MRGQDEQQLDVFSYVSQSSEYPTTILCALSVS